MLDSDDAAPADSVALANAAVDDNDNDDDDDDDDDDDNEDDAAEEDGDDRGGGRVDKLGAVASLSSAPRGEANGLARRTGGTGEWPPPAWPLELAALGSAREAQ